MSLGFVVALLMLSPFVIGTLASLFEKENSLTPVVIHRPIYVVEVDGSIRKDVEEEKDKFLNGQPLVQTAERQVSGGIEAEKDKFLIESSRLEESQEALEILQEIPSEVDSTIQASNEYEVSEIPPELDISINQLFAAIGVEPEAAAEQQEIHPEVAHLQNIDGPLESGLEMDEHSGQSIDEMIHHLYPVDQGANVINFPSPSEYNLSIPPNEYWALQQKYGPDVLNRITTTPAQGGTGDYDCMIGKVEIIDGVASLKYRDHHIPLKGLEQEGVFLVEGMFVKPDLFYVTIYTELDSVARASNKAAEN